jgi:hypothetical protein
MNKLHEAFWEGFHEGWTMFWSPFTGLYKAIAAHWRTHLGPHDREPLE